MPSIDTNAVIRARFVRPVGGRFSLEVDVAALHAYLDLLGVPVDPITLRYCDGPPESSGTGPFDSYAHKVRPSALLRKPVPGQRVLLLPLHESYRNPVAKPVLDQIARSLGEVLRLLVDHFRPVQIRVEVTLKPPVSFRDEIAAEAAADVEVAS